VGRGVLKEEMVAEWGPVRADSGLVPHRPKLMLEFDAVEEGGRGGEGGVGGIGEEL
jgi:hypothetical protein